MANLPDLVSATARATKRKRTVADEISRAFIRQLQSALARDGEVHIFGFGRFTVKPLPGRPIRDFATGKVVDHSEPSTRIWFQPYQRTVRITQKGRPNRSGGCEQLPSGKKTGDRRRAAEELDPPQRENHLLSEVTRLRA